MSKLIQSVSVQKTVLELGESTLIEVKAIDPAQPQTPVDVWIDGGLGAIRSIRFDGLPGPRTIPVLARATGGQEEATELQFDVRPRSNGDYPPFLSVYQVPHDPWQIEFRLNSIVGEVLPFEMYEWDLGDGQTDYSPWPSVSHDYWLSMDPDELYQVFQVSVRGLAPGGGQDMTEPLTLTLWNPYVELKHRGIVRPRVYCGGRVRREGSTYTGGFAIHNPEREQIVELIERRYEFFFLEEMDLPTEWTDPVPTEFVVVGPGETREVPLDLLIHEVPRGAHSVGVHLTGFAESGMEARASAYFELYPDPARLYELPPSLIELVDKARANLPDPESIDYAQLRALALENGLPWQPCNDHTDLQRLGPDDDPPCDPDIVCAEHNMVSGVTCQQLEKEEEILVRGYFANARKGDAIFSPGSVGVIGRLLGSIGQRYAHCGIMTRNQTELTHCTQSQDWLLDEPTGLGGERIAAIVGGKEPPTEGFEPDAVRFGWPGTVSQAADAAVRGSLLQHPGSGNSYCINAFNYETARVLNQGQVQAIPPLVAHPPAFLETPDVRERLHRIADEARALKTHYRFYAYTDADIGNDPAMAGPDGSVPAVCSSFIWLAAQRQGVSMESQAPPLDGLYFYSEAQRRTAGEALHSKIIEKVDERAQNEIKKALPKLPYVPSVVDSLVEIFTNLRDDVANQLCNTFAFDRSEDLTEAWRKPGDGRAVSPDDILWNWDEPALGDSQHGLYGDVEPLVYRQERFERRRRNVLRPSHGLASVSGRVVFRNRQNQIQPMPGARVIVSCAETLTGPDGRFAMKIPQGDYELRAGKQIETDFYEARVWCSYAKDDDKDMKDIELHPPPPSRRKVEIGGFAVLVEDDFPDDERRDLVINEEVRLSNHHVAEKVDRVTIFGEDETRGELDLEVRHLADHSIEVSYHARFFEGTSLETSDLAEETGDSRIVPPGGTECVEIHLENHEAVSDDWCEFRFKITNDVQ